MSSAQEYVRHDAASLYRFVESICDYCSTTRKYPAYLEASRCFLSYVEGLGKRTREYLAKFPSSVPADPTQFNIYRQELWTLRSAWFEMHKRVKPVADADTLHLPSPLIRRLMQRLSSVAEFGATEFAVFHTEKLNYLQVVATNIRDTAQRIASIISAPEPFPQKLGLIGIPYSQSGSLFLNCLIGHEMGHFVFGEKQLRTRFASRVLGSLNAAFSKAPGEIDATVKLTPQQVRWIPTIVADWLEELFCDVFAIRLIGPCYSYAFIEIFDLANLIDSNGNLSDAASSAALAFSDTHPADLYRIQQQVVMLEKLGWWTEIQKCNNHYISVLQSASSIVGSRFSFALFSTTTSTIERNMLDALFSLMTDVTDAVEGAIGSLDSGVEEYRRLAGTVAEYLKHGVVPSTIPDPVSGGPVYPTPVTVINVAYEFYLQQLPDLISSVHGQDRDSIADRNTWLQKLEFWTLKALDDYALLTKQI